MARERKKENKLNKEQTKTASSSSTRFLVSSPVSLCVMEHNGTMAWHTHTRYPFKYTLGPSSAETDPCSPPKTSFSSDNNTDNPNPVKAVYLHTLPPKPATAHLTYLLQESHPFSQPDNSGEQERADQSIRVLTSSTLERHHHHHHHNAPQTATRPSPDISYRHEIAPTAPAADSSDHDPPMAIRTRPRPRPLKDR
jgi:hypothetical protein